MFPESAQLATSTALPGRFPRPWGCVWQDLNAVDFNGCTVSQKKTGTVDLLLGVCVKMSLSKGISFRVKK